MKREEWIARAKKRFIEKACVPEDKAQEFAEGACDEHEGFNELDDITPEDAVDSELSYWGD